MTKFTSNENSVHTNGQIESESTVSKAPKVRKPAGFSYFADKATILTDHWGIKANDLSNAKNNTSGIQNALNDAASNGITDVILPIANNNGIYYIDGTYTDGVPDNPLEYCGYDGPITIPSGINFDLGGSTLQQIPNNSTQYALLLVKDSNNITIKNGTLIGDRKQHEYTIIRNPENWSELRMHEHGHGVSVFGGKCITVSDLSISEMIGDGVCVSAYARSSDTENSIVEEHYSDTVTIVNNTIWDCRRQGVSVTDYSRNIHIENNTISEIGSPMMNNGDFPSELGTAPGSCIDLESHDARKLFELDGTVSHDISNIQITGNTLTGSDGDAILVSSGVERALICDNTISRGVILGHYYHVNFEHNTINNGGIVDAEPIIGSPDYSKRHYPGNSITTIRDNTFNLAEITVRNRTNAIITGNKFCDLYKLQVSQIDQLTVSDNTFGRLNAPKEILSSEGNGMIKIARNQLPEILNQMHIDNRALPGDSVFDCTYPPSNINELGEICSFNDGSGYIVIAGLQVGKTYRMEFRSAFDKRLTAVAWIETPPTTLPPRPGILPAEGNGVIKIVRSELPAQLNSLHINGQILPGVSVFNSEPTGISGEIYSINGSDYIVIAGL